MVRPVDFAGGVHHNGEDGEEGGGAGEERVVLHLENEVEEAVDAGERGGDEQRTRAVAQDAAAIESDQERGGGGGGEVGRAEGDELRKREQTQVKEAKRGTDEQVVESVQPERGEHFEEEEGSEEQGDEERAVFGRAFDRAVAVNGGDEIDAEAGALDLVSIDSSLIG